MYSIITAHCSTHQMRYQINFYFVFKKNQSVYKPSGDFPNYEYRN